MTPAERWLRERLAGAPPRLLEEMAAALPTPPSASVAEELAAGALVLYGRLLGRGTRREDALPLLAADALLTHALEAQAEADPEGLPAFAARWGGAGRLGELAMDGVPRATGPAA